VFLSGGQSDEAAHRPPERHEPARGRPLAAELLLRPGPPGPGAQGLEGRGGQRPGGPAGLPPPGPAERGRPLRQLDRGHGERRLEPWQPGATTPRPDDTVADALAGGSRPAAGARPTRPGRGAAGAGAVDRAVYEAVARTPTGLWTARCAGCRARPTSPACGWPSRP
jgi:hypothetical protein